MSGPDALFLLRNNFYLGAYQAAINESSVEGLSDADFIERDCLVYRSYIALGSYQVHCALVYVEQLPYLSSALYPHALSIISHGIFLRHT